MEAIVPILAVVGAVLLLVFLVEEILQTRLTVVKEERRLVIYRQGKFSRLVGPGWVWINHRFETIERILDVRDKPWEFSIPGLFLFGIPLSLTLSFWCRIDPMRAAGKDKEKLKELVMFTDLERHYQAELKIRESLVNRLAELERTKTLPAKANIVDKIIPILPGTPDSVRLLSQVEADLRRSLPTIGMFYNPNHRIAVTEIVPPQDLMDSFSRNRVLELLSMRLPGLSDELLAQMVAAIEGLKPGIDRTTLNLEGQGATAAPVDVRWREGRSEPRVWLQQQPPAAPPPAQEAAAPAEARPVPAEPERLSAGDLSYLKPVPSQVSERRSKI